MFAAEIPMELNKTLWEKRLRTLAGTFYLVVEPMRLLLPKSAKWSKLSQNFWN